MLGPQGLERGWLRMYTPAGCVSGSVVATLGPGPLHAALVCRAACEAERAGDVHPGRLCLLRGVLVYQHELMLQEAYEHGPIIRRPPL